MGVAHLAVERRKAGLALMAAHVVMLAGILTVFTAFSTNLLSLAVQPRWLAWLTVGLVAIALAWTGVIVWSFVLVRPPRPDKIGRFLTTALTIALCALVLAPTVYAARVAYLSRDVVTSLFTATGASPSWPTTRGTARSASTSCFSARTRRRAGPACVPTA